jgi:Ca2+:H+ antiporter
MAERHKQQSAVEHEPSGGHPVAQRGPRPYRAALLRRAWWALLPLGPIAFLLQHTGASPILVFFLGALGTLPAAALLGQATEEIAAGITVRELQRSHSAGGTQAAGLRGAKLGGLLNATFGNIPELIVGVLSLQHGYVALVKATIVGSVIGNLSLVLGLALLTGGIRHGTQRFDAREVGHHAVLMTLAAAALVLPSLFLNSTHSQHITTISLVAAGVLLAVYVAYLLYSMFGLQGGGDEEATFIEEQGKIVQELHQGSTPWPLSRSIPILAVSTVLIFAAAEALIGTVDAFTVRFGWSPVFVGIVVIPVLANVAEHSSAVLLALKNKADMAFGVASGSSIQVAVFVTPLLVLASQIWHPLTLVFSPLEIAALGLTVAIFYLVSRDGESNWLEGFQLTALYVLAATVFFYVPGTL